MKRNINKLLLVMLSILVFIFIYDIKVVNRKQVKTRNYITPKVIKAPLIQNKDKQEKPLKITKNEDNYILATLRMDKIRLKGNIYRLNSPKNDIKYGIELLPGSSFPSKNGSSVYLVGHSGFSNQYIFANLDKLRLGDIATFRWNNTDFKYKVYKINKKLKTQKSTLISTEKNKLILITCDKYDYKYNYIVYLEMY